MRAPTDRARVAGDRRRLSPVLESAWMLPEDITSDLLKKVFQARSLWFIRTAPAQTSFCPAALKMLLERLPVVLLRAISLAAQSPTCWEVPSFKPPPSRGSGSRGMAQREPVPRRIPAQPAKRLQTALSRSSRSHRLEPRRDAHAATGDREGCLPACGAPGCRGLLPFCAICPLEPALRVVSRSQVGVLHLLPAVTHSLRLRRRICARPRHATSCSSVTWRFLCRRYDFMPGPRSLRCGSLTGVRH